MSCNRIFFGQGNEIERLYTWYNPQNLPEHSIPGEDSVDQWRLATFTDIRTEDRLLKESTKLAWEICPSLAVHFPTRYLHCTCLSDIQFFLLKFLFVEV